MAKEKDDKKPKFDLKADPKSTYGANPEYIKAWHEKFGEAEAEKHAEMREDVVEDAKGNKVDAVVGESQPGPTYKNPNEDKPSGAKEK